MSLDQETIDQQLDLLAKYRRTLAALVQQQAQFSAGYIPAHIINGITEARSNIVRIKAYLHENGVPVEDEPNDEAPPQIEPVQRANGDVVSSDKVAGDNVGGDQVMGDQYNANTGGGDYAEGDIHKQGAFVSGGTVGGSVIGQQTIYQTLPVWLRFLSAFVIVMVLAVVMLGASGGVTGIRRQLDAWGVLPTIQPEQPGETLLVIAPFYYTEGTTHTEAHREIARAVQAAAQEAGLTNLRVALAAAPLQSDDRDGAEQIGAHYNASLVVWGDDTGVRVTVNFLNRRGTPEIEAQDVAISETARTQIADPPAYSRFITDDLPRQLSFLSLFAVGQSFYIKQDYDAAIRVIERAVDATSEMPVAGLDGAYFRLGWLYQNVKHNAVQARRMYDYTIALAPKDASAYSNRANVRKSQGDIQGALADYDQAIALAPKFFNAYYNRGLTRAEQNNLTGAIADYDQAIALDPKYFFTYINRGNARSDLGDIKGALADYDQAIALAPKYPFAYINRGLVRYDQGDLTGAIADYSHAIALNPKYAVAYNNRGNARSDLGDLTGAIADYDQAIALDPKYADAYYNRGIARHDQGDIKGALADYDQTITLDPKYARAYLRRGNIYIRQGDRAHAIADFEQVLRLTDDAEMRRTVEEILRLLQK